MRLPDDGYRKVAEASQRMPTIYPPLVSVIVSNYNYGRYLREAVDSVFSQDYAEVECIVVDDCSTDGSEFVIADLKVERPQIKVKQLLENSGQSAAIIAGFEAAQGNYILFLDADDVLFPSCVSRHLALHMSSTKFVGFSCCDALQMSDHRIVLARNPGLAASFTGLPFDPTIVSSSVLTFLAQQDVNLNLIPAERVRHVPWNYTGWAWSTTSSMFFRRDALELVMDANCLRLLRLNTDNFLANLINHLSGSLLLDEQLVGYRHHGKNGFARRLPLDGFHGSVVNNHGDEIKTAIIDDLLGRFDHYGKYMSEPVRILEICALLDGPAFPSTTSPANQTSRFGQALQRHHKSIEALVGPDVFNRWAARFNLNGSTRSFIRKLPFLSRF